MIIPMSEKYRDIFMLVAWSHFNRPYKWGGDDPMGGIDCSGLVVECLKSVGAIGLHDDLSADGIWNKFKTAECDAPIIGALAFWFNAKGAAYHVAICLDGEFCITPDSGGSATHTLQDAIDQNAFVKIRRIDHRLSKPRYISLFI